MSKKDVITNWYNKNDDKKKPIPLDKNYKNHYIPPCAMISIIGPTGSGKSNALVEFLSRKNDAWYEVILFTGSTTDEPLYDLLKSKIEGIQMIDDVKKLPELTEYNNSDKSQEKLMIFDDIINLKKTELITIQKWYNSARKYGFTCIAMAQNYPDLPIQIRRNTMIWMIFKLNDINTINTILKNHNIDGKDKEVVKKAYFTAVKDKGNFFMIDFKTDNPKLKFRQNFLNCFDI